MKYICDPCDFYTNHKTSYDKHLLTKKHIEKLNLFELLDKDTQSEINSDSLYNYMCQYCNNNYSSSANLSRHKATCNSKNFFINELRNKINDLQQLINQKDEKINFMTNQKDETIIILKNEIEHLKKQQNEVINQKDEIINILKAEIKHFKDREDDANNVLKNEVDHLKYIVNNTGSIIKTSMSALAFVMKNYNQAPPLTPITDFSELGYENDNVAFVENLMHKFNNNKLRDYIGDFIIKEYKKDEARFQSMWNSDMTRLNYLIRGSHTKHQKDILREGSFSTTKSDNVDWHVDKKGICVIEYIIQPILNHIEKQISQYLAEYDINYNNDTASVAEIKMKKMQNVTDMLYYIENKSIYEEILRYISPSFYLSKTGSTIPPNNIKCIKSKSKSKKITGSCNKSNADIKLNNIKKNNIIKSNAEIESNDEIDSIDENELNGISMNIELSSDDVRWNFIDK